MLHTTALATHDVDHVGVVVAFHAVLVNIYFEEKLGTTSTRFCVELTVRAISMKMTP